MQLSAHDIAETYYGNLNNIGMVPLVTSRKRVVLFSGVPGSGKTTVAQSIESELHGVRISNDDIRDLITATDPGITPTERERVKGVVAPEVLERAGREQVALVIIDASCDRGYGFYREFAERWGYRIVLLRLDIPRHIIEERIRSRKGANHKAADNMLRHLDAWWQHWEYFGKTHRPALTITPVTPIEAVLYAVG